MVASSRTHAAVEETAAELRERVVDVLGGVDVLVASPSAIAREPIATVSEGDWAHVLDVQLTGAHRACQVFQSAIDSGSIVTVSSMDATLAMPETAAYSSAKGGTDSYTGVAAKEFGPDVRVNAIRPGFILTPQTAGAYAEGTKRRAHRRPRGSRRRGRLPRERPRLVRQQRVARGRRRDDEHRVTAKAGSVSAPRAFRRAGTARP